MIKLGISQNISNVIIKNRNTNDSNPLKNQHTEIKYKYNLNSDKTLFGQAGTFNKIRYVGKISRTTLRQMDIKSFAEYLIDRSQMISKELSPETYVELGESVKGIAINQFIKYRKIPDIKIRECCYNQYITLYSEIHYGDWFKDLKIFLRLEDKDYEKADLKELKSVLGITNKNITDYYRNLEFQETENVLGIKSVKQYIENNL